ncbi:MAG: hypothetical protein HPY45_07065 [Anaerolineae bacterium]|nr:hypothetical protein [Anaerolineae bacterium]
MDDIIACAVECYSGYTYPDQPRAFCWQGLWQPVAQVLARWRTPDQYSFRVLTQDGTLFILSYNEVQDNWCIYPE